MKNMFDFMFKVKDFPLKAGTYFVLALISSICLYHCNLLIEAKDYSGFYYLIPGFLVLLVMYGFCADCVKTLIENKEICDIPQFDFLKNFRTGIKFFLSAFILFLAVMAATFIASFGLAFLAATLHLHKIMLFLAVCYSILIFLVVCYFNLAFYNMFSRTNKITSFVNFVQAHKLISLDLKNYLVHLAVFIGVNFAFILTCFLLGCLIAFIFKGISINILSHCSVAIGALIGTYLMFVNTYLIAHSIKTEE